MDSQFQLTNWRSKRRLEWRSKYRDPVRPKGPCSFTWPYLLTTKLSCLQKNNFGHTILLHHVMYNHCNSKYRFNCQYVVSWMAKFIVIGNFDLSFCRIILWNHGTYHFQESTTNHRFGVHNLKGVCSYLSRDIRTNQLEHTLLSWSPFVHSPSQQWRCNAMQHSARSSAGSLS